MSDDGIKRELGISRRQLMKRGAVVGGTILWAAPVIQSLSAPAFAQTNTPKPDNTCCACKQPNPQTGAHCQTNGFTQAQCDAFCGGANNVESYTQNADCINNNCVPR